MSLTRWLAGIALIPALMLVGACAAKGPSALELKAIAEQWEWPDPARFEEAMVAFEQEPAPPKGAIVGIGSSSMRGWHAMINEDLAPLTIIPRGFGGSFMSDALHFADRIVIPYEPRAVLLYEGDNDLTYGDRPPEAILAAYRAFVAKVHESLPETRIYFLSIKPSPARWNVWPAMQEANELIRQETLGDRRLYFIDVSTPMLDANGEPIGDLYIGDRLHMTRKGYEVWRDAVRPVLLPIEEKFEKQ